MSRAAASRYQAALVVLHWLIALMILGMLGLGFLVLGGMPNADPRKLNILVLHASIGMAVLVLMIARLIVRLCTARPAAAGPPLLHRLAVLGRFGLYAIVFAMIATGWFTGFLVSDVFAHPGARLPDSLAALPSFQAHAALSLLLTALIVVHVLAALYHQFVLKDGLLARMGFGRRTVSPRA